MGHLCPRWSGDPQGHGYSWAARALRPRPWGSGQCQVAWGLPSRRPRPLPPQARAPARTSMGSQMAPGCGVRPASWTPLPGLLLWRRAFGSPRAREDDPGGVGESLGSPHSARMPRPRPTEPSLRCWGSPAWSQLPGSLLGAGLQLGPWLALTHCPFLGVLTPHHALLAPATPTMVVEGTPPEASVPLPCSVWLPQPQPFCTAEIRADACPAQQKLCLGVPCPQGQGPVLDTCVLVSGDQLWAEGPVCAESGLPAPGRQVWPARGHVSSQAPGGIWTCLLLGALPFTIWSCYLPESVGMRGGRARVVGGRPAGCGLLGGSSPGRDPDPAAVRPQAAVIHPG